MNELLWFVLHYIAHLMEWSHLSEREAIQAVVRLSNQVLIRHNDAVRTQQKYETGGVGRRFYWVDTHDFSDNQCVLLGLLDRDEIYKLIDEKQWFDVVSAVNYNRWKHAEQGSALEGFVAILGIVAILAVFTYFFLWPFVNVAINYSDIISGLF